MVKRPDVQMTLHNLGKTARLAYSPKYYTVESTPPNFTTKSSFIMSFSSDVDFEKQEENPSLKYLQKRHTGLCKENLK